MSFNVADKDDPEVLRSFLAAIDNETPLTWSSNVVQHFPEPMQKYYVSDGQDTLVFPAFWTIFYVSFVIYSCGEI